MLRNCLWCGILYRVRDPGDSRRASLKLLLSMPGRYVQRARDPGDSRRASLKQEAEKLATVTRIPVIPAIRAGPH